MLSDYLPVLMQILVAIGFSASMLTASVIFGKIGRPLRGEKRSLRVRYVARGRRSSPFPCEVLPRGYAFRDL